MKGVVAELLCPTGFGFTEADAYQITAFADSASLRCWCQGKDWTHWRLALDIDDYTIWQRRRRCRQRLGLVTSDNNAFHPGYTITQ